MTPTDTRACACLQGIAADCICSFNAQAVALMCEASFADALDRLGVALDRIKLARSGQEVWNSWLLPSAFHVDDKHVLSVGITVCERESSFDEASALSMYRRAFVVMISDEELLSNPQAARLVEAIILFNIGLCFHSMSLTIGAESGSGLVSAAKSAYCGSFALLNPETASTSHDHLLRLALCNNVGHICAFLCEFREAQSLLQLLKGFLLCFQDNDKGRGPIDDTLFDFYYNAIAVYGTYRTAPAA